MAFFNRKSRKPEEYRAEEPKEDAPEILVATGDSMLQAILGQPGSITKAEARNIPGLQGCINFVAGMVSMLPVKLYEDKGGKAEEVLDDPRLRLLNDETGDTLDAVQFWRAIISDYYLGKGGYAYINKKHNEFISLHYVDENNIAINTNNDPIFKDYDLMIQGVPYKPFDFIKVLRNTKDGASGKGIIDESPLILSVMYHSLVFEENLVKKGGNKKGFVKSTKKLSNQAMDALKAAWRKLYSNNSDNVVILNDDLDFKESSNSSVEMQLRENKEANSAEVCKLFNIAPSIINGDATAEDFSRTCKIGIMPVLRAIECALNKDLLLEKEKGSFYFAFDIKEMLKGSIKERYEAYKVGLEAKFLQIDEVRYMEDLPALGLEFITMGLDTVLYDVKKKVIYTPNTDKLTNIGGERNESYNQA